MAAFGRAREALICVIGDEDTVTGFLLAGVGEVDAKKTSNFLVVNPKTSVQTIEDAFKTFTQRDDVAVVLITQTVAETIRHLLDEYSAMIPTILEIPSKENAYDPTKDSIMVRIMKKMSVGDS
ncbi:vacuolar H+ ATPase F subunit [Baffinella frigidus]|nr:vacuolar H+ ATPase F subunit [Cryptophyta sp. CCMP2293]|eukprot:CAMPEP_0180135820 /NCGR_PEP_ID=MMETSP0986-20121125/11080_1 /TAXON_ID=697907 /ORGANISM="non described non described, Strain CCMP2293" /LENGTH=122 /DNA_ID=CAMNT_0022076635 /DNA_START=83 /DNA_END=451 /DNA_ORIENTATION=+